MTLPHIPDPMPGDAAAADALPIVIIPRIRDIGGFEVRRALPSAQRQMVGPFIFFDQFGPITMQAGQGQDVRPHPHIGLSTVTWLFDGVMYHRDSLGSEQADCARRIELDDGGQGHCPFRAHPCYAAGAVAPNIRHSELGGAAQAT